MPFCTLAPAIAPRLQFADAVDVIQIFEQERRHGHGPKNAAPAFLERFKDERPRIEVDAIDGERGRLGDAAAGKCEDGAQRPHGARVFFRRAQEACHLQNYLIAHFLRII
jgi:hypothetical protein